MPIQRFYGGARRHAQLDDYLALLPPATGRRISIR